MNRPMLLALLEAAKHKLAEIEVRIRHLLGAMSAADLPSEPRRLLDALQLQRSKAILEVARLQDELASSPPDGV